MQNVIEVSRLQKKYGEMTAVNNISFFVKQGELFAFLGENGAGKSTTINMLSTILPKHFQSHQVKSLLWDTSLEEKMLPSEKKSESFFRIQFLMGSLQLSRIFSQGEHITAIAKKK